MLTLTPILSSPGKGVEFVTGNSSDRADESRHPVPKREWVEFYEVCAHVVALLIAVVWSWHGVMMGP